MKKVCPKCGTTDYIILKAKNDAGINIYEQFLCACLNSGDIKNLKEKNIFTEIKKWFINFKKEIKNG